MRRRAVWLVGGRIVGPAGIGSGAIGWDGGRLLTPRRSAPAGVERIVVRGAFIAPGLIDLHAWGRPSEVASEFAAGGTTAFLTTAAPSAPEQLIGWLDGLDAERATDGAVCLGAHLEGPFVNPAYAGALPRRWMRPAVAAELRQLRPYASRIRLMTLAPELPGATRAIRWCVERRITVSMGHTDADAIVAQAAVDAGARAVTHVFNRMRPLHHREPGLAGVALTDPRLAAMAILDGVHISPLAFRLLVRARGRDGVILVTDAVRHATRLRAKARRGAWYRNGVLAGSNLTMIGAVRNAVRFAKIPLGDAVRMASANPARLLGDERRGELTPGRRADVVVFDDRFRLRLTVVGGEIVFGSHPVHTAMRDPERETCAG